MLILAAAAAAAAAAVASKPHIVVAVVDDLGWNGFGFNSNNTEVLTPHVDALARDGVILDRHYAFRFCSPSRASLFSGRIPGHGIWQINPHADAAVGVTSNITYIGGMLRHAGYETHLIGKWHQGFYRKEYTPVGRGFSHSYGFFLGAVNHFTQCCPCNNKFPATPDWADHARECPASQAEKVMHCNYTCPAQGGVDLYRDDAPAFGDNGTYSSYLWNDEAVRVISQHDTAKPLFIALMLHDVHQPVEAPQQFLRLYPEKGYNATSVPRRFYNAMHSAADSVIGNVTDALKERGMYSNSVLVVYGDNGGTFEHGPPVYGSSNYPKRGFKYSFFEGGVRTIAMVHSPLLPSAVRGTRSPSLFHVSDWYATFCTLAGLEPDDGYKTAPVDGVDAWPRLVSTAHVPRAAARWQGGCGEDEVLLGIKDGRGTGTGALVKGNMKLIVGKQELRTDGWSAQYAGLTEHLPAPSEPQCAEGCLFDVIADPREMHDLYQEQPAVAASMMQRYNELVAVMNVPNDDGPRPPAGGESLCQVILRTGFFQPWVSS